jgi:NADH-quinone oxidoreductase subunit N
MMPLSPLITLAVLSVLLVVFSAFVRSRLINGICTIAILILALAEIPGLAPGRVATLFLVDSYAVFFLATILLCSLVVAALAVCSPLKDASAEVLFFPLLLISTLGAGVIVMSSHFISFLWGSRS